jgi:hypothetical protein
MVSSTEGAPLAIAKDMVAGLRSSAASFTRVYPLLSRVLVKNARDPPVEASAGRQLRLGWAGDTPQAL